MRIACVCRVCDVAFALAPSRIAEGRGVYCSDACYRRRPPRPLAERFWSHVEKTETCWLWTAATNSPHGYGAFRLDGKTVPAHRVAYELTYGLILPGLYCCHHCDTPPCVCPDHLFLGTHGDNVRDMIAKQRHWAAVHPELVIRGALHSSKTRPDLRPRGERAGKALLTEAQVREMLALRAAGGWTQQRLAARYGVGRSAIANILCGITWRHVTHPEEFAAKMAEVHRRLSS